MIISDPEELDELALPTLALPTLPALWFSPPTQARPPYGSALPYQRAVGHLIEQKLLAGTPMIGLSGTPMVMLPGTPGGALQLHSLPAHRELCLVNCLTPEKIEATNCSRTFLSETHLVTLMRDAGEGAE